MSVMFITYNDLDDMRDSRKRSQINAFVNRGRKANKVKFAQRQARAVQWQSQHPIRSATPIKTESEASTPGTDIVGLGHPQTSRDLIHALLKKRHLPKLAVQYGPGGARKDPFASLPIPQTESIDRTTYFCMCSARRVSNCPYLCNLYFGYCTNICAEDSYSDFYGDQCLTLH